MSKTVSIIIILLVIAIASLAIVFWPTISHEPNGQLVEEGIPTETASSPTPFSTRTPDESVKVLQSNSISNINAVYSFSATIPKTWQAQAVEASDAIAIYNPAAAGANPVEQAQIFIRYFSANDFQTLSTVTIHSKKELTLGGLPAVQYDIEKKSGIPNFPNQPTWRSSRHIVTDIRSSEKNPTIFYVIAKSPTLRDDAYQSFLDSFNITAPAASLVEPITGFTSRITKKPFGIQIDPATSPVQPEKFSGYHTGVDVEYEDTTEDVPVYAIAKGTVLTSRTASGYGGIVAIQHEIQGKSVIAMYGHLDPKSLVANGTAVTAGEKIGILGENHSTETDGERKHLHLAILNGTTLDLRGYVQSSSELSNWINPLSLY